MLEQIKDQLEKKDAHLIFCDIPKDLPSGLKMKRFLKDTGVVLPTNKAFAFRQLDDAMEWVMSQGESTKIAPDMSITELADVMMFMGQPKEAMQALESAVTLRTIKADHKVFKIGEDDDELLLVRSGMVKVTLPIRKKDHYHLVNCGPGEFIGGTGFLEGGGHATEALALTDVEVYVLSRKKFNLLARQHPTLTLAIIENVALSLSVRLRVTISELQALRG
jgi:SulP family sulfate permease